MAQTKTITTATQLAGDVIGATTETKFDSVQLDAGSLKPGRHVRVTGRVVVDGVNGSDTMRVRLRLGADALTGVVIADSGDVSIPAGGSFDIDAGLTCLTAGTSGTFDANGVVEVTPQLLRPKTVTMTDDDSAASNGTAVYVAQGQGGAKLVTAAAGTADTFFLADDSGEAWRVEDSANPSGELTSYAVYFDEDATTGSRLLHAGSGYQGDFYVAGMNGRVLKVTYDADAATNGVAVYIDDNGGDPTARLLFVSPTDASGSETTSTTRAAAFLPGVIRTTVDGGTVDTGAKRYVVASLESSSANAGQLATLSGLSVTVQPIGA